MINHKEDQEDRNNGDVRPQLRKRSVGRNLSGPNPQVNWRVEEDIKDEIEEQARRRGVPAGQIIKDLWRSQHAEVLMLLQHIVTLVSPKDISEQGTRETGIDGSIPSPFAHRDPSMWVHDTPDPDPVMPEKRSRLRKFWSRT